LTSLKYSTEKGLLVLSEGAQRTLNVSSLPVLLLPDDACFGGGSREATLLLEAFIGYDTVLISQLHVHFRRGFVHNTRYGDLYNLHIDSSGGEDDDRSLGERALHKLGVLSVASALALTTTTLVAFTLRETHARVLRFTLQMRFHHRQTPGEFSPLLLSHSIDTVAFIPVTVGVLMFLFDFFSDTTLAFMIFSLVWASEIFFTLRARPVPSLYLFPRLYLAMFLLFLIYLFSFPLGFLYVAFSSWFSAVVALTLHFCARFPLLERRAPEVWLM